MGVSTTMSGAIVLFLILFASIAVIGSMFDRVIDLAEEIKSNNALALKMIYDHIIITNYTINSLKWVGTNLMVNMTVLVENKGQDPLWDMNSTDIYITYLENTTGNIRSIRLVYGVNWSIPAIILTENFSIPFNKHPLIDQGETGIVNLVFYAPINTTYPIRITFVSQYGSKASTWVSLG